MSTSGFDPRADLAQGVQDIRTAKELTDRRLSGPPPRIVQSKAPSPAGVERGEPGSGEAVVPGSIGVLVADDITSPTSTPGAPALPGVWKAGKAQLICELSEKTAAALDKARKPGETYGDVLVRALIAHGQELEAHFSSVTAAPPGDGFFVEHRPNRPERIQRKTMRLSRRNAQALATLLSKCGLEGRYSPLVEEALRRELLS